MVATSIGWSLSRVSDGFGNVLVTFSYALIALVIAFIVSAIVALVIGTPLALLMRRILANRRLSIRHALGYFLVGVLSALILDVVALAVGSDIPATEAITSSTGMAFALFTGLCAAAGWLTVWRVAIHRNGERF